MNKAAGPIAPQIHVSSLQTVTFLLNYTICIKYRDIRRENMASTSEFSRTLSLLRKERGVSQRTAAGDLGISQALLSH